MRDRLERLLELVEDRADYPDDERWLERVSDKFEALEEDLDDEEPSDEFMVELQLFRVSLDDEDDAGMSRALRNMLDY